jgi:PleD family two-component response regulator
MQETGIRRDVRIEARWEGRGRGACFTVRLPLHSIASIDQAAEPLVRNDGKLAGVRILAVDDTQDSLNMLQLLLAGVWAEVKTALSGEGGLRTAADAEFDLIISNISMPGMDGHDFILHLHIKLRRRNSATQVRACYSSYCNTTNGVFSLYSAERLTIDGCH